MTIDAIMSEIRIMSPKERIQLINLISDSLLETEDALSAHSILEFRGVAAHLADNEDPQAYVSRLRDE